MTSQKVAGNAKIAIASRDRSVQLCTGLFINNEFVEGHGETIVSINPADQSTLAAVHSVRPFFALLPLCIPLERVLPGADGELQASVEDIDQAVKAARHAATTTWGTNTPATERAALMNKLADVRQLHI
jgi:aldehyde dehydrogenase (NAD+)